jgi:hypothetical protein
MTAEHFTYWLQGFFELSDVKTLDQKQVKIIKDHLNLVYNKVTPNREIQNINEVPPTFFHSQCSTGRLPDDTLFCSTVSGTSSKLISSTGENPKKDKNNFRKAGPYTGPSGYQ